MSQSWHYKPPPPADVFIGNGPIRRLNPDLPWDETPEDIKNIIRSEEKKHREVQICCPNANTLHTLWLYGAFTQTEEEQIKTVHDTLQKRIEEIEKITK